MAPPPPELSGELVQWLCDTLSRACHLEPGSVTACTAVLDLGLDSLTFVSVLTQAETAYRFELSPDDTLALLEATHVDALARALAAIIRDRGSVGGDS